MAKNLDELLDISIELEMLMSELYFLYEKLFPEDRQFWWKMANEEVNHASLLESGRIYLDKGLLPEEILFEDIDKLEMTRKRIQDLISAYKRTPPSYQEAYYEAVKLESSATELHFQLLMTGQSDSKIVKIFQELNGNDQDHSRRISELLTAKITG